MRALVSASDVAAVLSTHVDRVHDAVRRLGATEDEAVEITEGAALDLVEALARTPETVGDLVGGLYARARALALRVRQVDGLGPYPPPDGGGRVLHDAEQDARVAAALDALPEQRRFAVLLRDSYGLDVAQSAVALGLDRAETARAVALGRLGIAAMVDDRELPSVTGHDVAIGDLGELSDGTASQAGRYAALRRHVSGCPICAAVLDLQTRGRALVGALQILALDDADRVAVLGRASAQAVSVLPSAAEIVAELDGDIDEPRVVSPLLVGMALLIAAILGGGVGALFATRANPPTNAASLLTGPVVATTSAAPVFTPVTVGPTPSRFAPRPVILVSPTLRPTSHSPSPSTSPSVSTSVSTSPSTTASTMAASIVLEPASGPAGTPFNVLGRGFTPGDTVTVTYDSLLLAPTETTTAIVGSDGTFTATLTPPSDTATGVGPSSHLVTATDGTNTATATYRQTTD